MTVKDATAVILAAGKGVRMRSALPKVMHKLSGRPLLGFVIKAVRAAGIKNIVIVVGKDKKLVIETFKDVGIKFAHQKKQLGTGDAVRAARSLLKGFNGTLLVLAGDAPLITSATLRRALEQHQKAGAACTMITAILDNPAGYGRIIRGADGCVERIVEEKDASNQEKMIKEVNSGNYVFDSASLFKALSKIGRANKQGEYYLTDCIEILGSFGRKVWAISVDDPAEILGINSREELAEVGKIYRERIIEKLLAGGVSVIDPENTYIDDTVSIGEGSIIYPFTVIVRNVKIGKGVRIGPFSFIRDGAVIGDGAAVGAFAEITRQKIDKDSRACPGWEKGEASCRGGRYKREKC